MKTTNLILSALLAGGTLVSCGGSNNPVPATELIDREAPPFGALLSSDQPRDESPVVSAEIDDSLANDNLDFAIRLYQEVTRTATGNVAFAPYSISSALSMLYAGAGGMTETDMKSALNFSLPRESVFPAFNSLDLSLNSLSDDVEIEVVNNLWGQQGLAWKAEFLDTLAENYGAGMNVVDFTTDPESIRNSVNNWVTETTNEQIKNLLPEGTVSGDTRFIITNAIYLNADWLSPFDADVTTDRDFQLLSGSNVSVPTMSAIQDIAHTRESYYDVFELPYIGNTLSMVFLVPDTTLLQQLENDLSRSLLESAIENMQSKSVSLTLPKFKASSNTALLPTLSQLGMSSAFEFGADFSRMVDDIDLVVTEIAHQAVVAVDEKGTEAAAATAVVGGITSVPEFDLQLEVDRPFLFLIRDKNSSTNLFMGRVVDPTAL